MISTAGASCPPLSRKPIDPSLQGGDAHGAFAWGVPDRSLEDERLEIAAI